VDFNRLGSKEPQMRAITSIGSCIVAGLLGIAMLVPAAEKQHKAYGIEKRTLWTTSHVQGSPEPPSPYQLEVAFPKLRFDQPLELTEFPDLTKPGSRFAVAERKGKIYTFENSPDTSDKHLLLDAKHNIYGLAFHPRFAQNGYFYVMSITADEKPDGSRVSRYRLKKTDPPEADPSSETVLFVWPSGGHNGGCLRFGPDGYLYIACGDGSGIADGLETGQDINDVLASILRIDVDRPDQDRNYYVPSDNPFVNTKGARPEVWAYGLRQAWKFGFDSETGDLWAGEVGQDLWESVYKIEKGGNYGWSVMEGSHPFRPQRKKGPTPIIPPIVEHNHDEFRCLVGGYVYHGKRFPELEGAYIYGDYDTGRVRMFRYDPAKKKATDNRELTDTQLRIVCWGQDSAGEVYAVDYMGGRIYQLAHAPPPAPDAPKFPRRLSETGLFASTKDHIPAAGVIPYSVNAELWADGASKERFLAIPGDGKIEYETMTYPQPAPGAHPGWKFPTGTVMVKTFSLEQEAGNPQSRRRLETRLLVGERVAGDEDVGDQVWSGYTYVWNDDQTDADLLDAGGLDRKYTIKDAKAPNGVREQVWHFPSRAQCTMCHTMSAKYVLGVNTLQMNRDHDYGGAIANQLATLEHLGMFTKALPKPPEQLPHMVDYRDKAADLDARARSYLHANCSHCHRKWGGGNADFQLLFPLELKDTGTLDVRPAHGTLDLDDARLLAARAPDRSLIYQRMARRGLGQMPQVASNIVDQEGVELIREWIKQLQR
jgi:uncharacterized repeat protein (TIGR03806 family)